MSQTAYKKQLSIDTFCGLADQAVVSLTNFLLAFFLIKNGPKEDYGLYSIGYTVILLAIGLNNALITTQMTVKAPQKSVGEQNVYCANLLVGQSIIFALLLITGVVATLLLGRFQVLERNLVFFSIFVGIASAAAVYQDFFRRFFYLKLRPNVVLSLDVVQGMIIFAFLFAIKFGLPSSDWPTTTIICYAAAACVAGTIGLCYAKLHFFAGLNPVWVAIKEAWMNGKWALSGVIITHLQTQSYTYFLAGVAGTARVAEANAARLLLSPLGLLSTGLTVVFLPRLAIMKHNQEYKVMHTVASYLLLVLVGTVTVYSLTVFAFKDWIITIFLKKEYGDIGFFILLWSIVFLFQMIRSNASILLQVFLAFRALTLANIPSAVLVVASSYFLIHSFGVTGGLISLAAGELLFAILLQSYYHNVRKHDYN
jgi:O-antigen/teichoic acid export membrane protein